MSDRKFGESTAIDQIRWASFPSNAQRIIRGCFEDITLDNTDNPDRGNTLVKELAACISRVSVDRPHFQTNGSLGHAILEEAETRRNFNTGRLDEIGRQLQTLGQSLLAVRATHDPLKSA